MDEYLTRLENLPTSVRGLCYHDDNGDEYVILNARLTREANWETYNHEQKHIERGELYESTYIEY